MLNIKIPMEIKRRGRVQIHVLRKEHLIREWSMQFNTPLREKCCIQAVEHIGVTNKMRC